VCVYVGMTGLTPEERFRAHQRGEHAARVVKKFGRRLLPELYQHFNPLPYELAKQMEPKLARQLRADGLAVWLLTVDVKDLYRKYAKPLPRETDGSFKLSPHKFVLGITREYVELPRKSKIAARVEGRSTLARLGLVVHLTAPTIHSGFPGRIVLEMYNFGTYPLRCHRTEGHTAQRVRSCFLTSPKRKRHSAVGPRQLLDLAT
jgi:hypothetical protein